jgi:hypothetical protein
MKSGNAMIKCRGCPAKFPDVKTGGRRREYCTQECRKRFKSRRDKVRRLAVETLIGNHTVEYIGILHRISSYER